MSFNPPEPPEKVNQGGSSRRMTLLGIGMWLLLGAFGSVLLFVDAGRGELVSAFDIAVRIALITLIALVLGAIVFQILKRLNLAGTSLTNMFWGILFSVGLPILGLLAAQQFGMLPESSVIVSELIDALPISDEAFEGIRQAREVLAGG